MTNDKEPKFDMVFPKGMFTDEQLADLERQVEIAKVTTEAFEKGFNHALNLLEAEVEQWREQKIIADQAQHSDSNFREICTYNSVLSRIKWLRVNHSQNLS